jgi:hypothetical protein
MKQQNDSRACVPLGKIAAAIWIVGLALLCWRPTFATPMRCSGEQKTCIANCAKSPPGSSISLCLTNCGARQSMCMKTGCWDNGTQRYCGLLKQ